MRSSAMSAPAYAVSCLRIMSTPARRPSNRPSRRQRADRAYRLTLATGAAGVAPLVLFLLGVLTRMSLGPFFVLPIGPPVLVFALRSALAGRWARRAGYAAT